MNGTQKLRRWLKLLKALFQLFVILSIICSGFSGAVPVLKIITFDFSGGRAFKHLKKQVEFGPRVPGTPPHLRARAYIKEQLKPFTDRVEEQAFIAKSGLSQIEMFNVIAFINHRAKNFILLGAHYDTRPFADKDYEKNRNTPIPGANDGASGVAILLELARALHGKLPPNFGVILVFFDGEDYGKSLSCMFYGSRHFAQNLSSDLKQKIKFGIVVDMVGDSELEIIPESASEKSAPEVYNSLFELQDQLGLKVLLALSPRVVYDDHLSLIDAKIKSALLIDLDYPYWHTLEDTPDKCSEDSLRAVGLLLLNLILNYASETNKQ